MKKQSLYLKLGSWMSALVVAWLLSASAVAQCIPTTAAISNYALTYQVVNEAAVTRVQFFLDYTAVDGAGAYGVQLQVFLAAGVQGVDGLDYDLEGSWLFAGATLSVALDYKAVSHRVTFEVMRTDCMGDEGSGFIGELIIHRAQGCDAAVQRLSGGIVMVDNVDAG